MSTTRNEDLWYWIWDDSTLTIYEKAFLQSVIRRQFRGNSVLLTRKTIMALASMSLSQVVRCEASLGSRGMLSVERTGEKHVFRYHAVRVQLDLFGFGERSNVRLARASVETAVGNTCSTARLAGAGTGTCSTRRGEPPELTCQTGIETEHLINSKAKTRAEVRPRDPQTSIEREQEQRLRIESRDRRLVREIEYMRENIVGCGPGSETFTDKTIAGIARRMDAMKPLSTKEYEERKRAQKSALAEYLKTAGGVCK